MIFQVRRLYIAFNICTTKRRCYRNVVKCVQFTLRGPYFSREYNRCSFKNVSNVIPTFLLKNSIDYLTIAQYKTFVQIFWWKEQVGTCYINVNNVPLGILIEQYLDRTLPNGGLMEARPNMISVESHSPVLMKLCCTEAHPNVLHKADSLTATNRQL